MWEVIGGLISIAVILLGYFLGKDRVKEKLAADAKKAEEDADEVQKTEWPKEGQEARDVNASIRKQAEADEKWDPESPDQK